MHRWVIDHHPGDLTAAARIAGEYTIVWSKQNKFKLEIKTPSQFVRPVNNITEETFQLPIPTGRLCSMTLKYCHILVLDVGLNLDAV